MKWMLDTDTCIALIKGKPPSVLKKLRGKSVGQVGISSITLGELAFGAAKSGRRDESRAALAEFLLALEIASFDGDAASSYGQLRASLEKRRTPIGPLDTLIGAHAAALDVVLVTHNTREFGRIGTLRLEDWTSS
jgi:tRNA(fMet)-specific endonuclease VapC